MKTTATPRALAVALFLAVFGQITAISETVTFAPPEGTATNVLQVFSGATALVVAGPGTVSLSPANSHAGGTTLSGGTLLVSDGGLGSHSPVGTGALAIAGGTLRGSGTLSRDISASVAATFEGDDTLTLAGNNTFADALTISEGTVEIAGGTTTLGKHLYLDPASDKPVGYLQSGGSVTLGANNLQLSYKAGSTSSFTMTGGSFDANNVNVVAGYSGANSTATVDISGDAVFSNANNFYAYQRAGNTLSVSVHDGGTLSLNGNLYANGSGSSLSVDVSRGGAVAAKRIYAASGSGASSISVTDDGILGFTNLYANVATTLFIDGGILRCDGASAASANYWPWLNDSASLSVSVGPGGVTFKDGGKTTKYAQISRGMTAVAAGPGETPRGVTFDGGNWTFHKAQSYEGPTVIKNGASLFIANAGEIPASSVVTVAAGSQLRNGGTAKSVKTLVLGEGAILGFSSKGSSAPAPEKFAVSEAITLPRTAKIAIYNDNVAVTTAQNAAKTYALLDVPSAYADALRAVHWSCATAASNRSYSFSVADDGTTATLSMTISSGAKDTTGDFSVGAGEGLVISDSFDVKDRTITVDGGYLFVDGNLSESVTGGNVYVKNGGLLDVRNAVRFATVANARYDLYLTDGGTLRTYLLYPQDAYSQDVAGAIHVDGGVFLPLGKNTTDIFNYFPRFATALVGAGGAVFDLSEWNYNGRTAWYRFSCQAQFNHDPDCAGTDGGITVRGGNGDKVVFQFSGSFAGSTLDGGIRIENGTLITLASSALSGLSLALDPGAFFKPYNASTTASVGSLTIGEANATDPVGIAVAAGASGPALVVEDGLAILSPVELSVAAGWNYDPEFVAGTYTVLVYPASESADPSLFRLPAGTEGFSLTAEETTLTTGSYAGKKALVATIAAVDPPLESDLGIQNGASQTISDGGDHAYGNIYVGDFGVVANHSLTVTDGNVSGNVLYVAYKPSGQGKGNAELVHLDTYEQTGGTVSVQRLVTSYAGKNSEETSGRADTEINISGGLLDVAGNVELSYNRMWSGLTSTVNVSGGRLAVGGNMRLINYNGGVYAPAGILNVTGGEVDVAGVVDLSRTKNQAASTKQSGIRLHGGLLKAGNVIQTTNDCPYASFYFNGGTYAPYGATAANRTMQGLNAAYVSTNGAVISTAYLPAGETYEIAQALLADPALGGATDGGLVKKGAGTLALSGANTYTGRTVVEAGTLAVANAAALTGDLTVANGALLDATGIDLALSKIRASGVVAARSLSVSGAIELAADGSVLSVDGDLALVRGVTIDFGALDEAPAGRVAVAAVSGNVAIPDLVRARNSGSDTRCQMEVEDGILYANPTTTAFVMVIR